MQAALTAFYIASLRNVSNSHINAEKRQYSRIHRRNRDKAIQSHYKPHRIGMTDRTIERREKPMQTATAPYKATKAQTHTDRRRAPERVTERHQERRQTTGTPERITARRQTTASKLRRCSRNGKADPSRFLFCAKNGKITLLIIVPLLYNVAGTGNHKQNRRKEAWKD